MPQGTCNLHFLEQFEGGIEIEFDLPYTHQAF